MNSEKNTISPELALQKPLRWWPGVIIVILQWAIRFGLPAVLPADEAVMIGVFGGFLGGLAIVIWWVFLSRAPKHERWTTIVLIIVALYATSRFLDISIKTANMGMMFVIFSVPVMSLAFVVWVVATRNLSNKVRRITMVVTIFLASGFWLLLRTNGMSSDLHFDFSWRWARTNEEKFLSLAEKENMVLPTTTDSREVWPGFRGEGRDGIVQGIKIKTNWKSSPPTELWRRSVGPGCSSFAVSSGLIYTQEQRGEAEVVSCYVLASGKPVWVHSDKARFWDAHAGAGPRATPTLSNGRLYTLGGTGILNALNAKDGTLIWSRNAVADTKAEQSGWGYAASPLVVDSLVIVATSGRLAAYDLVTGRPRWFGPANGKGYSSPQLATIDGVKQIILMSDTGGVSIAPADGKQLWSYRWPTQDRILQPGFTDNNDILFTGGMDDGMRRVTVSNVSGRWNFKQQWKTDGLAPYFNDFVVHNGYAYGFNGRSLACIDLKDGKRMWQGGRFGGQLILLADQDVLLILSEKGEVAIVSATPDTYRVLAEMPAIKGKTWNHPVLAGDILLVRNTSEMAAFRMARF